MTEGICPSGWHIPSEEELYSIIKLCGGRCNMVRLLMKSTSGWDNYGNSSGNGSNSSGFNGLPSGRHIPYLDAFNGEGIDAHWWSSSDTR